MEPLGSLEGQVSALQHSLQLLVGLLIPCLALLVLLSALLLVRWRLCQRVKGQRLMPGPPASPQLFQPAPSGAVRRYNAGRGITNKQVLQPESRMNGHSSHSSRKAAVAYRSRGHVPRASLHSFSPAQPSSHSRGEAPGTRSSSTDFDKHPVLVPPNSPAATSDAAGVLEREFPSCHTSTHNKPHSCSRLASATRSSSMPFEFGSSIHFGNKRTHFNSANFTASQGPGLDSDFGASAGISVRILSTDSEGSPNTPLLPHHHAEMFEWDYYDPSYKSKVQLHHPLPPICSKQYWL